MFLVSIIFMMILPLPTWVVDVLIGINLLREGLDIPECAFVGILDADKEGYLRSQTSLIQTAGRAARHLHGEVVLFADVLTGSIRALLEISDYRRTRQEAYNKEHGITPRSMISMPIVSMIAMISGWPIMRRIASRSISAPTPNMARPASLALRASPSMLPTA